MLQLLWDFTHQLVLRELEDLQKPKFSQLFGQFPLKTSALQVRVRSRVCPVDICGRPSESVPQTGSGPVEPTFGDRIESGHAG